MTAPRVRLSLVAAVFLGSALAKLLWPSEAHPHAGDPAWYRLVLSHEARYGAASLELGLAGLLLSPFWRAGLRLSLLVLAVFLIVTGAIVRSGYSVTSCGCFGKVALGAPAHVALLIGLALLLVSCLQDPMARAS